MSGPGWLKNLYFLYLLIWRATVKAGPYWLQETFYTGNVTDDALVKDSVMDLLMQSRLAYFAPFLPRWPGGISLCGIKLCGISQNVMKGTPKNTFMDSFRNCPSTFDETLMFTGDPVKSRGLKVSYYCLPLVQLYCF